MNDFTKPHTPPLESSFSAFQNSLLNCTSFLEGYSTKDGTIATDQTEKIKRKGERGGQDGTWHTSAFYLKQKCPKLQKKPKNAKILAHYG